MAIEWYRVYHGTPTDAKWLVIARRAKVAPGMVVAVWAALMDHASQADPRGDVSGFDTETFAAFAGWAEDDVKRIVTQLAQKRVIEDGTLAAWVRRNPKREDDSTERVRRHRERKSNNDNGAADPPPDPPTPVTPRNAAKRNVTPDESRVEKKREEPPPPEGSPPAVTQQEEQEEAVESLDMRTALSATLDSIRDTSTRKRIHAAARMLISGDDLSAWRDPQGDGGQVPLGERPRLFRLALAKLEAEGNFGANDLRSCVRYVVECERGEPLQRRKRTPVPVNEYPGAGRSGHSDLRHIGADPEAERKREEAEKEAIGRWMKSHPTERASMAAEIESELREDPQCRDMDTRFLATIIEAKVRERVRKRLEDAA